MIPKLTLAILLSASLSATAALKVHGIFGSHMVIQRDKPIQVWGWADVGAEVSIRFGNDSSTATAAAYGGLWKVTFPARAADSNGVNLTVKSGGEIIAMEDILIGDVWVMNGQSNMAFGLAKTTEADMESAQAHLPLLRRIGIKTNESENLEVDVPADKIEPWVVATPQTAGGFGAIGFSFGSRIQRALQIPIGIIDNSRGGASIESLVPRHKFAADPLAAAYLASVEKRRAEFNWDTELAKLVAKWEADVAKKREQGVAENRLPARPTRESIPSWNMQIPGLHPQKKMEHGVRAARWALNRIYKMKVDWDSAALVSAEPEGDRMVLTFDKPVMADNLSMAVEGFSIADASGKFYKAYAVHPLKKDSGIWNTANKSAEATRIRVWSPLVSEPVAVRYAWSTSPLGNLKVNGREWLPLQSFRTDTMDWPESDDPDVQPVDRASQRTMQTEAEERLKFRRTEEARQAVEILEKLESLPKP